MSPQVTMAHPGQLSTLPWIHLGFPLLILPSRGWRGPLLRHQPPSVPCQGSFISSVPVSDATVGGRHLACVYKHVLIRAQGLLIAINLCEARKEQFPSTTPYI
jgi:hypothetical protein